MEARLAHAVLLAAALLSLGASARTENFIVTASSPELAREAAQAAEQYRHDLAIEWLGKELPRWSDPCPITINEGAHLGAGGVTKFYFGSDGPHGWLTTIQGSRERLLDSVLPHEITHMILATHFGRALPRWADEGASTTIEHESERGKQDQMLITFLTTGRGIAFNRMFAITEYPADIMPLYAQGYSLSRFLIEQGGRQKFVAYLGDGMSQNNWTAATNKNYGYKSLSELQVTWLEWVRQGSPPLEGREEFVATRDDDSRNLGSNAQQPEQPFDRARGMNGAAALDSFVHDDRAAAREAGGLVAVSEPADDYGTRDVSAAADGTRSGVAAADGTRSVVAAAADGTRSVVAAADGTRSVPATGWYSRQRDRAEALRSGALASDEDRYLDESPPSNVVEQSTARPQPIGRPQPMVIKWTDEPGPATALPAAAPVSGSVGAAAQYGSIAPDGSYRPGSIGRSPIGAIYRR